MVERLERLGIDVPAPDPDSLDDILARVAQAEMLGGLDCSTIQAPGSRQILSAGQICSSSPLSSGSTVHYSGLHGDHSGCLPVVESAWESTPVFGPAGNAADTEADADEEVAAIMARLGMLCDDIRSLNDSSADVEHCSSMVSASGAGFGIDIPQQPPWPAAAMHPSKLPMDTGSAADAAADADQEVAAIMARLGMTAEAGKQLDDAVHELGPDEDTLPSLPGMSMREYMQCPDLLNNKQEDVLTAEGGKTVNKEADESVQAEYMAGSYSRVHVGRGASSQAAWCAIDCAAYEGQEAQQERSEMPVMDQTGFIAAELDRPADVEGNDEQELSAIMARLGVARDTSLLVDDPVQGSSHHKDASASLESLDSAPEDLPQALRNSADQNAAPVAAGSCEEACLGVTEDASKADTGRQTASRMEGNSKQDSTAESRSSVPGAEDGHAALGTAQVGNSTSQFWPEALAEPCSTAIVCKEADTAATPQLLPENVAPVPETPASLTHALSGTLHGVDSSSDRADSIAAESGIQGAPQIMLSGIREEALIGMAEDCGLGGLHGSSNEEMAGMASNCMAIDSIVPDAKCSDPPQQPESHTTIHDNLQQQLPAGSADAPCCKGMSAEAGSGGGVSLVSQGIASDKPECNLSASLEGILQRVGRFLVSDSPVQG